MFLNSHWKADTPGSISQSVFEDLLSEPQTPPDIISSFKVHTFDVRRREKSDFELILCSIFVNEIIFPSALRLNSNETDFFLLYGSAGAGSEV